MKSNCQPIFSGALSDLDVIACGLRGSRACIVMLNQHRAAIRWTRKKEF